MRKFLMGLAIVSMAAFTGCGVGEVVGDINEAIAEQKAQADAETVFDAAITQVTEQVFAAVAEAQASAAPALAKSAEAETLTLDASVTTEDGAKINIKGSATVTMTGDLTTGAINMTLDITADWAYLKVTLGDGKVASSTGSETLTGNWDVSYDSSVTPATGSASGQMAMKGSFTVDAKSITFDVVSTASMKDDGSTEIVYTGTINGRPVNKTTVIPVEEEEQNPDNDSIKFSCQGEGFCIDFTGSDYTIASCSGSSPVSSCEPIGGWVGKCSIATGTSTAHVDYYSVDTSSACSGQWTAVQ